MRVIQSLGLRVCTAASRMHGPKTTRQQRPRSWNCQNCWVAGHEGCLPGYPKAQVQSKSNSFRTHMCQGWYTSERKTVVNSRGAMLCGLRCAKLQLNAAQEAATLLTPIASRIRFCRKQTAMISATWNLTPNAS